MKALNKMIIATAAVGVLGIGGVAKAIPLSQYYRATTYQVSQASGKTTHSKETPSATNERKFEVNDNRSPTSLRQVDEYGEAIYDFAKASNWTKAQASFS